MPTAAGLQNANAPAVDANIAAGRGGSPLTAIDTTALIAGRVREMDDDTRARYNALVEKDQGWLAKSNLRNQQANQLQEQNQDLARNIADARRQVIQMGPYRTEVTTKDEAGNPIITTTESDYITNMVAEYEENEARIKELRAGSKRPRFLARCNDALKSSTAIIFTPVPSGLWKPNKGESGLEGAARELQAFHDLTKERGATISKPRTLDEAVSDLGVFIDRMAKPPGLDGFARGHYQDNAGRLRFDSIAEIAFPQEHIIQGNTSIHIPDALAIMAFLFPDAMKEKFGVLLRENYPADGIPLATKPERIKELGAEILAQRYRLEDAVSTLERQGQTGAKRPTDSPAHVLLMCEPFTRGGKEFDFG